jgi:hypothetical protein
MMIGTLARMTKHETRHQPRQCTGLHVFVIVVSALFGGCAAQNHPARPALINHTVLIKLKNPADVNELIADCDALGHAIPNVASCYAGKRLEGERPMAITDYDVGFFLGFNTQADYDRYVEHPDHKAALAKWKPRIESLRIVDVLDPTP